MDRTHRIPPPCLLLLTLPRPAPSQELHDPSDFYKPIVIAPAGGAGSSADGAAAAASSSQGPLVVSVPQAAPSVGTGVLPLVAPLATPVQPTTNMED